MTPCTTAHNVRTICSTKIKDDLHISIGASQVGDEGVDPLGGPNTIMPGLCVVPLVLKVNCGLVARFQLSGSPSVHRVQHEAYKPYFLMGWGVVLVSGS